MAMLQAIVAVGLVQRIGLLLALLAGHAGFLDETLGHIVGEPELFCSVLDRLGNQEATTLLDPSLTLQSPGEDPRAFVLHLVLDLGVALVLRDGIEFYHLHSPQKPVACALQAR